MKLIAAIKKLNSMFPEPPYRTMEDKKRSEKAIVSRYAQGNASLQFGKYVTGKEVEKRKSSLSSFEF